MNAPANGFARTYWREFEGLAVRLVESCFKIRPDIVYVTQATKDGGFDGEISTVLANGDLGALKYRTLIEAKLKSQQGGLRLRDIASTLLIAYNEAADALVLVTNCHFSPQAFHHLCVFLAKTNINVRVVDGATLSGWVRKNRKELLDEGHSARLLDFLIVDDQLKERKRRSVSDCTSHFPLTNQGIAPQLTFSSGCDTEGKPVDCNLRLNWKKVQARRALPALAAPTRRKPIVESLVRNLRQAAGIAVLRGPAGVGKTVILDHVINHIVTHDHDSLAVSILDVGNAITSRRLFVDIIYALSGLDPQQLVAGDPRPSSLEKLLAKAGGRDVAPAIRDAVTSVLLNTEKAYFQNRNLAAGPLLEYLELLVRPHARRRRPVLFFRELNRASTELLAFLHQASRRLAKAGVTILFELREHGQAPEATVSQESGTAELMSPLEWEEHVKLFRRSITLVEHELTPLSAPEVQQFLETLLPGLGAERADVIRERVGGVPLYLQLTAQWLDRESILNDATDGPRLVEKLEAFYIHLSPDSLNQFFDKLIEAWWQQGGLYRSAIAAAALMNGRLHSTSLSLLDPSSDVQDVIELLLASGLFRTARDDPFSIEVAHSLLRERMTWYSDAHHAADEAEFPFRIPTPRSIVHADVARRLLPHIRQLVPDEGLRELQEIRFLAALHQWDDVCRRSLDAGRTLSAAHQWGVAAQFLRLSLQAYQWSSEGLHSDRIQEVRILCELLEVEYLRYRIGSAESRSLLDRLLTRLRFAPELDQVPDGAELRIRAKILEWRHHYVREEFGQAFEIASDGCQFAEAAEGVVDVEVRGKAMSNYAVSLKVLDRRDESIDAFDRASTLLPRSVTVKVERLSNLAAHALRTDPISALSYYRQLLIIAEGSEYSFSEIIHAHVDLAMANFLASEYPDARRDAQYSIRLAADNGVPAQEARARNILGCCYWVANELQRAHQQFDLATMASERSVSYRFLWRMRTNMAGTALEQGKTDLAYALARSAQRGILAPRLSTITKTEGMAGYLTSRWYAALLAIATYYHRLGKQEELESLIDQVTLPSFKEHVTKAIAGDFPDEVFGSATHVKSGRVMITG